MCPTPKLLTAHACRFCGASVTDADQHAEYDCPVSKRNLDRLLENLARSTAPAVVEPDDDVVVIEPSAKRRCVGLEQAPVHVERPGRMDPPTNEALKSHSAEAQALMDELHRQCEAVTSKSQARDKKKRKVFDLAWQVMMGRNTSAKGASSFEHEHNLYPRKGVYMKSVLDSKSRPKWQKELYATARALLMLIDPEYAGDHDDWCVSINAMFDGETHKCLKHTDKDDVDAQLAMTLGDFEGGELRCWREDGSHVDVNNRRTVVRVDGRLPHQVMPFREGKRYSIIWYKLYDRRMTAAKAVLQEPCFV